jgi:prepilin-type N-terminal cleavage/methylation domain-containing protein
MKVESREHTTEGNQQKGFTFIEVLVVVLLMTLMMVGFNYTIRAYWEQINRSASERFLKQYGNSIVEFIARNIVNAKGIDIGPTQGDYGTFYVTLNDPVAGDYVVTYSATDDEGVTQNGEKIIPEFAMNQTDRHVGTILGPTESFTVESFKGEFIYRPEPPYYNPASFLGRVFQITLILKYTRENAEMPDPYERYMTFTSQVSLKNREAPSPATGS